MSTLIVAHPETCAYADVDWSRHLDCTRFFAASDLCLSSHRPMNCCSRLTRISFVVLSIVMSNSHELRTNSFAVARGASPAAATSGRKDRAKHIRYDTTGVKRNSTTYEHNKQSHLQPEGVHQINHRYTSLERMSTSVLICRRRLASLFFFVSGHDVQYLHRLLAVVHYDLGCSHLHSLRPPP